MAALPKRPFQARRTDAAPAKESCEWPLPLPGRNLIDICSVF